jgi:hypothetical protein
MRLIRRYWKMEKKKYKVSYESGATGYGWDESFDTIRQVELCITDLKSTYTANVTVFDYELGDFIFYKKALTFNFDIDFIFKNRKRDLRTKTRLIS